MIHELQNGQITNKHYLQWIIQSVIVKENSAESVIILSRNVE